MTNVEDSMQQRSDDKCVKLWTHHPSAFRLDDLEARIDSTRGKYWKNKNLGYRDVLPKLHKRLGTDQFLWCCTAKGCFIRLSEGVDLIEWELAVPTSEILAFYSVPAWEDIIRGQCQAWDGLFIESVQAGSEGVGAWVRFPPQVGTIKCLGPLPIQRKR
jgi:hypothetical protein